MFNSLPKVYDSYKKRQDATDRIMGNLSNPSSSFDHKNWTEEQKELIRILLTNMAIAIDKNSNFGDIDREITNIKKELERPNSRLKAIFPLLTDDFLQACKGFVEKDFETQKQKLNQEKKEDSQKDLSPEELILQKQREEKKNQNEAMTRAEEQRLREEQEQAKIEAMALRQLESSNETEKHKTKKAIKIPTVEIRDQVSNNDPKAKTQSVLNSTEDSGIAFNKMLDAFKSNEPNWLTLCDKEGNNLAHHAVNQSNAELCKDLLEYFRNHKAEGQDYFNTRNFDGKTALQLKPMTPLVSNLFIGAGLTSTAAVITGTGFIACALLPILGPIPLIAWAVASAITLAVEAKVIYDHKKEVTTFYNHTSIKDENTATSNVESNKSGSESPRWGSSRGLTLTQ